MSAHTISWYRPRRLPHLDAPGRLQAVTFRLGDSLPRHVAESMARSDDPAKRVRAAALLDAGYGCCLLRKPDHAAIVESALGHFHGSRYDLHAWVVMPNHVHALLEPLAGNRLRTIIHAWKSWTAKAINRHRGASGTVWHGEFFDRAIRDERHYRRAVAYIEENPVKAGLAVTPADWRFSSARKRRSD